MSDLSAETEAKALPRLPENVTRVNCNSLFAKRFMSYVQGDLFDVPGITEALEEVEEGDKGQIMQEPNAVVVNSRQGIHLGSTLRSNGVGYLNIMQATRRVASGRPGFFEGTLGQADPYSNGEIVTDPNARGPVHVAFALSTNILRGVADDRRAISKYLKSESKWDRPNLSVVKAANFTAALEIAAKLNELVGDTKVPIRLGHLMVFHSVATNVPVHLAEELHADVKGIR